MNENLFHYPDNFSFLLGGSLQRKGEDEVSKGTTGFPAGRAACSYLGHLLEGEGGGMLIHH